MLLIEKNFSSKVNINDVYDSDINNTILELLKNEYEEKCYQDCFIYKIIDIIKRSVIDCDTKRISVEFKAKVFKIDKYDILFQNEIQKVNNDYVLCKSNYFASITKNMKNVFTENFILYQKIPIIVAKVNYPTFKSEFTVNGAAFIPILKNSSEIYYNIKKISNDDKKCILEEYGQQLEDETEYMNENKNDKYYKYFVDMLYPFKDKKLKSEFKKEKSDLLKMESFGIVAKLNIFDVYEHEIIEIKKTNKNISKYLGDLASPIEIDARSIYTEWIIEYIKYLSTIRQLHENYGCDEQTFNENTSIYNLYTDHKI